MKTTWQAVFGGALAVALLISPISTPQAQAGAKLDIVDTAIAAGQFKTLVTAVKAADMVSVLKGPGPYTVFAPTDAAFAKLPAGTVEKLLKDKKALKNVLLHHSIAGNVAFADLNAMRTISVLFGARLPIWKAGKQLHLGNATVIKSDITALNGTIHVIDQVLVP